MLTPDDAARVQAIAAKQAVIHAHAAKMPMLDIGDADSVEAMLRWTKQAGKLPTPSVYDVDYLLQLVERLTQGQARDEANIGIPF